jgi:hypothetical protein
MMLATFLLGLILVMLIGALRTGAHYWEKGEQRLAALDRQFMVESQLRRHLHSMASIPGPVIQGVVQGSFEGESHRLSYTAPMPRQLHMAGLYRFDLYTLDNEGQNSLHLKISTYNPNGPETSPAIDDVSLLDRLEALEIRYLPQARTQTATPSPLPLTSSTSTDGAWQSSWANSLPPALIRIRIKPADEETWPDLIIALRSLNTR